MEPTSSTWLLFVYGNNDTRRICFICDIMQQEYSYLYCERLLDKGVPVNGSNRILTEYPEYIKYEITQCARNSRLDGVANLSFTWQSCLCKGCTDYLFETLRPYATKVFIEQPGFLSRMCLCIPEDFNQRFSKTKSARN